MLIHPHRSVLSQGPHTLHMWSYPDQDDEAITYQADKLSCATNPDIAESMAISILLDHYSYPVVLPNSVGHSEGSGSPTSGFSSAKSDTSSIAPSSPESSTSSSPGSREGSTLQAPAADTVTLRPRSPVLSTKKHCLKRFREESVQYASNLPQFLCKVNWMDRRVVEDVHWLLGHWDPRELDVTVALELLSMDYADEIVRRLAVQRLEDLSNDEVLKYLLQLVQVCLLDTDKCLNK